MQRKTGGSNGRLLVDIAGYRAKRRVALERFTREQADKVLASGRRLVLEPMTPADRKVIHDTVNEIAGVGTTSEGEEPRRRVVSRRECSAGFAARPPDAACLPVRLADPRSLRSVCRQHRREAR